MGWTTIEWGGHFCNLSMDNLVHSLLSRDSKFNGFFGGKKLLKVRAKERKSISCNQSSDPGVSKYILDMWNYHITLL